MKRNSIEIITTGEELLSGVTQDSNFFSLAKEVFDKGFKVNYQQCVGDNEKDIVSALEIASSRSNYILITGGLGPTDDDLTREAASTFFNKKLVFNKNEEIKIKKIFKTRKRKYSKLNKKQALFPEGSKIIKNSIGTAPGFIIKNKRSKFYFYPGVPREFKTMLKDSFLIDLKNKKTKESNITFSKMLRVYGLSESQVAEKIRKYSSVNNYIGYRPFNYEIHIRLISSHNKLSLAKKRNLILEKKVRKELGMYVYSESDVSLAETVVQILNKRKISITTAESCTGGMLANMITNVPGASKCFQYGFTTYSNKSKEKILNIRSSTLLKYGAVSQSCVREMVTKSKDISSADLSVAVSGIAGPGGGTKEKPVGTVFIGISYQDKTFVKKFFFPGSRDMFKLRTCLTSLDLVRRMILLKSN